MAANLSPVLIAVVLIASLGPPVGRADDAVSTGLLACAKLGQNAERLSCYDRLAERLHPAPSRTDSPSASVIDSAAPANMFGATPAPAAPVKSERAELASISARIVTLREAPHRGAEIALDNGQTWQQIGDQDMPLRIGQTISISRGLFGSFWLMTEGNRSCNVKRIL